MILHIYHCTLVEIRDYRAAPGRNRPDGTGRHPERPGEADIHYEPPTRAFEDDALGRFLALFQSIDLANTPKSPVRINWKFLENRLGLKRAELLKLKSKADRLGLMQRLTIDYDYEVWMQRSNDKGMLVVMTYVEEHDLNRDPAEYTEAYCDTIDEVRKDILNARQTLTKVAVVPNGHLAPRTEPGTSWQEAVDVLKALPGALAKRGYEAELNSYGYTKVLNLAINAHKRGYLLRVV